MSQQAVDPLTNDAREILERATEMARARGAAEVVPLDVLRATLQLPRSLADTEIRSLGVDPNSILSQIQVDGAGPQLPLRQLLVNANREAQVLGHYRVDSIHLLLAMMYSDSPSTAGPLQRAGVTMYDLRQHLQTGSRAGVVSYNDPTQRDRALRRRPWPSLRGVVSISPFFLALVGVTAASGAALWLNLLPRYMPLWTTAFVIAGWVTSLCIHEFGHALVAYLGGDRSVATAGYLSLNPLRYHNMLMSLVLPIVFLLLGGIALPGGAVYIDHAALRTKAWSSAVSIAGPVGTLLCGLLVAAVFAVAGRASWITEQNFTFFAALAALGFFLALAVVLNLLPVPGLDGFGIIRPWLPYSMQFSLMRYGTVGIYAVFIVLFFVSPVRDAFFQVVNQLTALAGIDPRLVAIGLFNMRFI